MKRILISALGLLLFSPALGCSSDTGSGGSGGSGGGATIAVDKLPDAALDAMCDLGARCGKDGLFPFTFSTKAACLEGMKASGDLNMDDSVAAVKAGKQVYNAANAAKCLALFKTAACGSFDPEDMQVCDDTFTGNIDNGQACTDSDYCKSGWCDGLDKPQAGCPGTCAAQKKEGEACVDNNDECEGALVCKEKKCVKNAKAKEGESCTDGPCEDGLKCVSDNGAPVCKKAPAVGEACLAKQYCAKGARCVEGKCAAPGTAGESCNFQNFTSPYECAKGLNCAVKMEAGKQPQGTCMGAKKLGEACTAVFECDGFDLYCKASKCAPLPKIGEDCAAKTDSPMFQCGIGATCDDATSKCVKDEAAGEGEDCSQKSCKEGLICNNDKCEKQPAPVCK